MTVVDAPLSPRWRADPNPKVQELREQAPVHRVPESGVYCLSRQQDVRVAREAWSQASIALERRFTSVLATIERVENATLLAKGGQASAESVPGASPSPSSRPFNG